MTKKKYTIEFIKQNMICLKLYCDYKEIKVTDVLNDLLHTFLVEKKDEIKLLMDKQMKIVELRKGWKQ